MTLNSLLIDKVAEFKSTDSINLFGRGVYRVLSVDDWNFVEMTSKSEGAMLEVGRPPSLRSDTVLMPTIVILLVPTTLVTFA